MEKNDLGFRHVFLPGKKDKPLLLLLHGTGANENDLIGLGQAVAPGFALLSPRGKVLENGMPRFFRRLAEGVFDIDDLYFRTDELADFIKAAQTQYQITHASIIVLGFSNGANIAASLLLRRPEYIDGAILIRAMTPYQPQQLPTLTGKNILMLSGQLDPIVPAENARYLASIFEQAGANLTFKNMPASHNLTQMDINIMADWLQNIQHI